MGWKDEKEDNVVSQGKEKKGRGKWNNESLIATSCRIKNMVYLL